MTRVLGTAPAILALLPVLAACGADGGGSADPTCESMLRKMAECYPGTQYEGRCTTATLEAFRSNGFADRTCDEIAEAGKADTFAFDGCDAGFHACGLVFCCEDYRLTWFPAEADWDIVPLVQDFMASAPPDELAALESATRAELLADVAVTFNQEAVLDEGAAPRELAVEISRGLIEVPYATFVKHLPAADWGSHLANYLGGEVVVYERDGSGRPIRQLERMVCSPIAEAVEADCTNQDMTKVEQIFYGTDSAIVYWRVLHSDNGSTEEDVGSVEFRAFDAKSTLVTFHSGHRVNAAGLIHIPNDLTQKILKGFFVSHIRNYRKYVLARLQGA
jgi:hypothetical protein